MEASSSNSENDSNDSDNSGQSIGDDADDASFESAHQQEDANDNDDEDDETLPLSERMKRQEERGVDLKVRRQRKSEALKVASQRLAQTKQGKIGNDEGSKKKKSKHAPTEASSKRSDFFKRRMTLNENGIGVDIGAHRYKPCDPRVSNLHGHLDVGHFEHNYAFLQEVREKEIAELRKRISVWKTAGKNGQKKRHQLGLTRAGESVEKDQEQLKRLMQEKADFERAQVERAAKKSVKEKLHQEVAEGKHGVYFPKRRELKRMHVEAKFEEIRKRGGDKAVDAAVAKRRKKNKSRDAGLFGGRGIA